MTKTNQVLVRYGAIPEISYFNIETTEEISRGATVVLRTTRGNETGELLQDITPGLNENIEQEDDPTTPALLRKANVEDHKTITGNQEKINLEFSTWEKRIQDWKLDLALIDLEWTLDRKTTILYVLNGRGSDCTVLAIKAAASGLGNIQVQPVDENGNIQVVQSEGGCCSSGDSCGCS